MKPLYGIAEAGVHWFETYQRHHKEKLSTVKDNDDDRVQQYVEQRARGAYIAPICQPEASFDYSVAAQVQEPMDDDYKKLNSRINWQIDHKDRGLRFIPIDLATAKVMVFTDGSFANNRDLSSQIGFAIMLVNESQADNSFKINGNLLHWSSTKCKRVTRSVLASEIYGMVAGFDIAFVLTATLETVMKQLGLPRLPLVVCTGLVLPVRVSCETGIYDGKEAHGRLDGPPRVVRTPRD